MEIASTNQAFNVGAPMGDADDEVCVNPDIYHCCKICARKRETRYLPQHLFFDILSYVPARVLLDEMKHVCGEWNLMISNPDFIRHHVRNSTSGIIIQDLSSPGVVNYVEMRRGSLEICEFDWGLRVEVRSSCNGLVLAPDFGDDILYVINPLTKGSTILPPYVGHTKSHLHFRLAFADASMEYKVVHARDYDKFPGGVPQIAVLTVGVDEVWRRIDIQHLSLASRAALLSSPLVTGVYIHWIDETFVLTLNVETETICQFPLPPLGATFRSILPMGSNLSIVSEVCEFSRDVWEMNPKTGKWVKLLRFDLSPLRYKLFPEYVNTIVPFGWLAVRKVLLFSTLDTRRRCVAFHVETGEMQSFMLSMGSEGPHCFQAHVESLVWPGGF